MKCPSCEADNREGARFCQSCGQPLEEPLPQHLATPEKVEAPEPFEPSPQDVATAVPAELPEGDEVTVPAGQPPPTWPATEVEESGGRDLASTALEPPPGKDVEGPSELESAPGAGDAAAHPGAVEQAELTPVVSESAGGEREAAAEAVAEEAPASEEVSALEPVDAAALIPISPGTVVADRYLVTRVLEVETDRISYHGLDLTRCRRCGFASNNLDDAFCAQCGAAMDDKPRVTLLQLQDPESESLIQDTIIDRLSSKAGHFVVLADQEAPAPESLPARGIRIVVGQSTDAGTVRELNEDSLLCFTLSAAFESMTAPVIGLLAVADGMGGHDGGEIASRLALQVLARDVIRHIILPVGLSPDATAPDRVSDKEDGRDSAPGRVSGRDEERLAAILGSAVVAANDAVYLARQKRGNDMGTTLTAALVYEGGLVLAHAGDSRAYRWGDDGLERLTTDHSLVARMIENGKAGPDEIYTHPQRNVIYRSIGDTPAVEVDTSVLPLSPGDRLLLCSDGLWEMIRDEGIADVMMMEADPQAACEHLVNRANLAGGDDNISVIVALIEAI